MKSKIMLTIFILLFAVAFLTGCAEKKVDTATTPEVKNLEPIKIGAVYPLSGSGAEVGDQFLKGASLAVKDINSKGGINGRNISLIVEDMQSNPSVALSSLEKLIDTQNVKFVVTATSRGALVMIPVADTRGILLFADATHPNITGSSKYVFRHNPTASDISDALLKNITEKSVNASCIIYVNDEYGVAFDKELNFRLLLKNTNMNILRQGFGVQETDFKTIITKCISINPDAVFVIGYGSSVGVIIKQLREINYDGLLLTDFSPVLTPAILTVATESAKGMLYTDFKENQAFIERYNLEYASKPGAFALIGYSDIEIIANAISAKGEQPDLVSEYIRTDLATFKGTYEDISVRKGGDILPPIIVRTVK